MSELTLLETKHPDKSARRRFEGLVGIDAQKQRLLDDLVLMFAPKEFEDWRARHHPRGLPFADAGAASSRLLLLSGEVGCGKTALASSVATPLAERLEQRVLVLETPSDIRGWGKVGEISARLTDAFTQAKARAREFDAALLIIDEADDLATSRAQMQAHHEDRAGLNVLLKQLDLLAREKVQLVTVLITNRASALDPALLRRAASHLKFTRPDADARAALFHSMLHKTSTTERDIKALVEASEREVPFSYSDLTERLGRQALRRAWSADRAFDAAILRETLAELEPSPLIEVA
ncbi:AAA family ATPase [Nannocystis bainbridge]|uniref:ATP-binding protein n=1 Tax=Nannocystis bainbridge TaxID=2995303 RepID=A0ABT5E644_9BACT|nr:ATP-binding protein [Nannocystis bainbridge]MDC0721332.1 ATP-binding protein [Nannocystis bainbridge]